MKRAFIGRLRQLILLWVAGSVALILVTGACLWLGLNFAPTAFIYLIVIVLLSLLDSIISSAIFSVVAVGCLHFFFTQPTFSLYIADPEDITALIAFITTSLAVTTLVRRLERLNEAQWQQTRLLNLTHDPIIVRNLDDAITYWNRGAEELYGWKEDDALGKAADQLLQTVFPIPLEEIKKTLHRTGRWEGELLHVTRAGKHLVVASRWSLQRDDNGQPLGTVETNNDVTDRRRAEEGLRRTQETYVAEAQQLSHTGSFGWSVESGEIFWSAESFRIFGYDPHIKPTIKMMLQRVHPDDLDLVRDAIDLAANERQNFELEHRLLLPDGSVKHLHVVAHAVTDEAGKSQFMGALMDITARKAADEALRNSERRYRHLFEFMPIGICQIDLRGASALLKGLRANGVTDIAAYMDQHPDFVHRVMEALIADDVNECAVKMFGARNRSELLGSGAFYGMGSPETFRRAIESQFRGEALFQEETKFTTLDGREINVLFAAARLGPPDDLTLSLVGLVDITERTRARETLQRVQADFARAARVSMLGELTTSIAHEVNQPLTAIRVNAETGFRWLGKSEPNTAKAGESLQRILEDASRASDVIARIRTMAAGRVPEPAALAIRDVIAESMVFLRHEIQVNEVSVFLDLAPGLPLVSGDRTQLQQVVVNLVINAVHALAKSGAARRSIAIRAAQRDAETVCCIVEDNGPGIDPANLPRLFDSFFTTKDGGMGMGLPISRSIIDAHGGHIRADNNSALGGARFSFTLPALHS